MCLFTTISRRELLSREDYKRGASLSDGLRSRQRASRGRMMFSPWIALRRLRADSRRSKRHSEPTEWLASQLVLSRRSS